MYYFDNHYLMQYLMAGADVRVYVDQDYYDISSADDLLDPDEGTGFTIYGEPYKFDYKQIEHIIVNGNVIDLEALQDMVKKEEPKEEPAEEEPAKEEPKDDDTGNDETKADAGGDEEAAEEDTAEEDTADEEPTEEEPKKEESIQYGDYVQNIDPASPHFRTRGSVVLAENDYIIYRYSDSKSPMGRKTVGVSPKQVEKI